MLFIIEGRQDRNPKNRNLETEANAEVMEGAACWLALWSFLLPALFCFVLLVFLYPGPSF